LRRRVGGVIMRGSVEVFNDLIGPRPLLRRNHEVDIPPPDTIERVIRHAASVDTHASQLVAPRQRRLLVLKHAHGLPALEARVSDRHRWFVGDPTLQETRQRHPSSLRLAPDPVSPGSSGDRILDECPARAKPERELGLLVFRVRSLLEFVD